MLNSRGIVASRGYERILFLIEWAAQQIKPITLTITANECGWPKSTTHLLLQSLVKFGYMRQNLDQTYSLVRLPGEPTSENNTWASLLRIGLPYLQEAITHTQETGCIAVLTDSLMLFYLNKVLPEREIRYDRDITIKRIPHQVASGLAILSDINKEKLDLYIKKHQLDEKESTQLFTQLEKAQQNGYVLNTKGTVEGAAGVAVPIKERNGQIIAAINIAGPKERIIHHQKMIIEATRITAEKITQHLHFI